MRRSDAEACRQKYLTIEKADEFWMNELKLQRVFFSKFHQPIPPWDKLKKYIQLGFGQISHCDPILRKGSGIKLQSIVIDALKDLFHIGELKPGDQQKEIDEKVLMAIYGVMALKLV